MQAKIFTRGSEVHCICPILHSTFEENKWSSFFFEWSFQEGIEVFQTLIYTSKKLENVWANGRKGVCRIFTKAEKSLLY